MNILDQKIFVLDNQRPAISFECREQTGELYLVNCLIKEFYDIPKLEWSKVLLDYHLVVTSYIHPGNPIIRNIQLANLMAPVHDHPIIEFPAAMLRLGNDDLNGKPVKCQEIKFEIEFKDKGRGALSFQFAYFSSLGVKEKLNYGTSGMGTSAI